MRNLNNKKLTTISDYADDEIVHVIHMYTDDPDGGMYSVTVEDAHRTPSVHLFNKEEYIEFMKDKVMENLIGKNVKMLEGGIEEINRINSSGVYDDFYTGQIVGDAGGGDWTIKINSKDVITYNKCIWSGVVSDRPDLIVLDFDHFEIL